MMFQVKNMSDICIYSTSFKVTIEPKRKQISENELEVKGFNGRFIESN